MPLWSNFYRCRARNQDYYQLGQLAYQTDGNGTLLASFTYDSTGAPVSVQVGSDLSTAPRYYYVYDGRGDVVNLVDASGNVAASYAYDTWGNLTSASESIPNANGWTNPYRYDGRDGVRYDSADGLYWMSVRAYDPTIGRFISHDPLGRAPLFFADQPYAYAGNNPVSNVDPSGQHMLGASNSQIKQKAQQQARKTRVVYKQGSGSGCNDACKAGHVKSDAEAAKDAFGTALTNVGALAFLGGGVAWALTKEAFKAFLDSFIAKAAVAGLAGIAVPLALGWFAFEWEANQTIAWFEHRDHVDHFFTVVQWGMFAINAILGIAALGNIEAEPVSIVFALSVFLTEGKVNDSFDQAKREQDKEYSRR